MSTLESSRHGRPGSGMIPRRDDILRIETKEERLSWKGSTIITQIVRTH